MKKMKKKEFALRASYPRLLPGVAEKEKPHKKNLRIQTEKLEKKSSASRFMLAPSAKFEIKKKSKK
jgi:hypothetical protein